MAGSSPPQSSRRWLPDVQSLQFRLTVGAVLASTIAIGGIAGWMGWRMEQNLVAQHRQRLWTLADRFDDDVALYREMVPTEEAIQEVIDYRTLGDTAIWVQSPQGAGRGPVGSPLKLTAWQSNGLVGRLQALSPEKRLERITLGDRTLLICIQPLVVGEDALGTLFIAKDVTADQQSLRMLITHLAWISGAMVVLLTVAMAIYVRRSLRPLQVMGQQVTTVTAEDLSRHPP
jgi:hypothetical protein